MYIIVEWQRDWIRDRGQSFDHGVYQEANIITRQLNYSYTNQLYFISEPDTLTAYGIIDTDNREELQTALSILIIRDNQFHLVNNESIRNFSSCLTLVLGAYKKDWEKGVYFGITVIDSNLLDQQKDHPNIFYNRSLKFNFNDLPNSGVAERLTGILNEEKVRKMTQEPQTAKRVNHTVYPLPSCLSLPTDDQASEAPLPPLYGKLEETLSPTKQELR